ncbi:MAG: serine hydrolase [Caulobacteraceae bacterium]|nr:serine hydrolase [Caulobacteraceae bacterium]
MGQIGLDGVKARLGALFAPFACDDGPGLVVGIARDEETIYRRGLGLASIEHGVINDPSVRMRIGSVSKHFASLAALLLAEEGKLDIDAPATDLLPELPPLRGVPTLRQFMNHTSGYRCSTDLAFIGSGMNQRPKGSAFQTQIAQADVNFAPGDGQLYCNGGYHLLSLAIERAAAVPFGRFLQQRIFAPLGMRDSEVASNDMRIVARMATMHIPLPDGGWRRGLFPAEEILGEGAIISTVDDMLIWLAHMRAPKIVGDARIWGEMTAGTQVRDALWSPYGLGLSQLIYRGVEVIAHGGGVPGGSCAMLTVPEYSLDVVMMGNGGPANLADLQFRVIDAVLGDVLPPEKHTRPAATEFQALHGQRYHAESGVLFCFAAVGAELGVSLFGSPPLTALHETGATLQADFTSIYAGPFVWRRADLFADGADRPPDEIEMSECGRLSRFKRLPEVSPTVADSAPALVGAYRCDDLGADADIQLGEDLALHIATPFGSTTFRLEPLSDRVLLAKLVEVPGFTMALTRAVGGGGFHLTGARTRRLQFDSVDAPGHWTLP